MPEVAEKQETRIDPDLEGSIQAKGLVHVPSVGTVARDAYDPRQVGLLEDLCKGAPAPVFNQFLELSIRYGLDPFMGQIWLAKMQGENAAQGGWVVMVGRDGLLAYANRQGDFLGLRSGVVYAADDFEAWEDEETEQPKVIHKRHWVVAKDKDGKVKTDDDGVPIKVRGKLLGAWAIAQRQGRIPSYWFAEYAQYLPKSASKREKGPWSQYDDGMIAKCAHSTALRLLYSVTGLVVAEEVSEKIVQQHRLKDGEGEAEWGDDAELGARLRALFAAANEIEQGRWLPKKIAVTLRGKTDDEREGIAAELAAWITSHGGDLPAPIVAEPDEVVDEADFTVLDDPERPEG